MTSPGGDRIGGGGFGPGQPGEGGESDEGGGDESCTDGDGDSYGPGCILGADCDDANPNFHDVCPDCSASNDQGCPCPNEDQVAYCYSGDPALDGVGVCKLGERTCTGGYWTGCLGEVLPEDEKCDFQDNNCDGQVDEGVMSPCGNCDKFCDITTYGAGTDEPFNLDEGDAEAVEKTPEDWVTLSENAYSLHFIWIANSGAGTVSKLDTETGLETGRYTVCSNPSRTSVDKNGDAWIGCRGDGKVAKVINIPETCPDANGNGVIDTSQDNNGDGTIQADEMVANDECIKFISASLGGNIRAVGVDQENYAWVGLWSEAQLKRIHPDDGSVVQTISISNNPYGLAIDQQGIIWVAGRGGNKLVRVDPISGAVTTHSPSFGCFEPYGITVDGNGSVWIGNCCCGHYAWRYHPASGEWTNVPTDSRPRGVAASPDGFLYVANDDSNRVAKIDLNTLQVVGYADLGAGRFPVGIAVDSQGYAWAVNQSSSSASKIDPNSLTVIHEQPVGSGPYTYSDMTGAAFFQNIAPEGFFTEMYGGWAGVRVKWESIDVEYAAPPGTWIDVQVRTADEVADLETTAWSEGMGPFPPTSFPVDLNPILDKKADYLQVRISLHTDNESVKPVVKNITIQYAAEPE